MMVTGLTFVPVLVVPSDFCHQLLGISAGFIWGFSLEVLSIRAAKR